MAGCRAPSLYRAGQSSLGRGPRPQSRSESNGGRMLGVLADTPATDFRCRLPISAEGRPIDGGQYVSSCWVNGTDNSISTTGFRFSGGPTQERNMSTQVVLITGGLTGIGRAAAVAFAKKGAKVVVAGRRDEAGKALVEELRSFGSEAEFINADVRKEGDVRALVDQTVARFGRLDVAVNNAGTEGQVGPITDQTAESYAATFDTNVLGVILSMKHEVRAMQGQGSGSIVNISSTYGHEGAAGASVYVGSKHAVEGITKSVAIEIAKSGIRVNGVAPGPTDTGMLTRFTGTPENKAALVKGVPMGRLGLSEELANSIVFIASDAASFITGHILNVDGGKTN